MNSHLLVCVLAAMGGILILYAYRKCSLKYWVLTALCGVAALIAADLVCGFFEFDMPLNAFTLSVSAVGGIPGVILLNILKAVMKL